MPRPPSSPAWNALRSPRRHHVAYWIVSALFIVGLIAGTISGYQLDGDRRRDAMNYVRAIAGEAETVAPPSTDALVQQAFWEHGVRTSGLLWLLGLSILGAPLILGTVFVRGFGLGMTAGLLMGDGILEGALLTVAGVLPHTLLFVPGILLAGGAALSFSMLAASIILGRRHLSAFSQFARTTALCAASAALLLAGSLVEAYITPVLLRVIGAYVDFF